MFKSKIVGVALAGADERPQVQVPATDALCGTPRAVGLDRWIFVLMAAWFIALVLIGFIPSSIAKIEQVRASVRPEFSAAYHIHAVLMGSFLCLLLVQSWLMATGRPRYHMQLGVAGFALAGAVVVGGILITTARYHDVIDWWQSAPPGAKEAAWAAVLRSERVAYRALSIGVIFTAFMAIAFRARRRDCGLHKRLIFLATAVPLSAATSRIGWLPSTAVLNTLSADVYTLATIAPLFAWDVFRNRRIHRAYLIWFALFIPSELLVNLISGTAWWHETIRAIMGGPA